MINFSFEEEKDLYIIKPKKEGELYYLFTKCFDDNNSSIKNEINNMLKIKFYETTDENYILDHKYFKKYIENLKKCGYNYKVFSNENNDLKVIFPVEFMTLSTIEDNIDIITIDDIITI